MKITNILLLCCLFSLASPAATVSVITPTRTSLTNATLPQATGGYQLGATAIGVSGLTNLTLPGYITLGNTTNRISDDGTNVTRNGTAIGTGGSALWTNIAGILSPYPKVAEVDIVNDVSAGDPSDAILHVEATDSVAALYADFDFSGSSINGQGIFTLSGNNGALWSAFQVITDPVTGVDMSIFDNAVIVTQFQPMTASGAAYTFNTKQSLTNLDSILLAQNAGSDRFRIDANSGYTGAGTLFLSDDGTYKAAGGGSAIWVNDSGTIQPASGQTTNRLNFTSGAADNATNVALVVDTAVSFTANGSRLVSANNNGTNMFSVRYDGAYFFGPGTSPYLSNDDYKVVRSFDMPEGSNETAINYFELLNSTYPGAVAYIESDLINAPDFNIHTANTAWTVIDTNAVTSSAGIRTGTNTGETGLTLSHRGTLVTDFNASIASTGSAVAYLMDTFNVLTNGDSLFQVKNAGVTRLDVTAAGAITGRLPVDYGFACSDETSALTTTTNAVRIQLPHAMTLTGVFASVTTPQSSGSIITVDLKEGGTSMLSTLVTIDNSETGSNTAATPAVISDTAIAQYGILVVSTTQVGTGGAGLKFWITGYR